MKPSILGTGHGTSTGVICDTWHKLQHNLLEYYMISTGVTATGVTSNLQGHCSISY